MKILTIVNSDWFFLMHMLPITKALNLKGHEVHVLAPNTGKKNEIISKGLNFINLPLSRKGLNPVQEIKTLLAIREAIEDIKPDVIHNITIKPIIYGSLIAKLLRIPTVNTICGLGYSFIEKRKSLSRCLAFVGYKQALNYNKAFHFFENSSDFDFFKQRRILVNELNSKVVKGVGADLSKYSVIPKTEVDPNKVIITLASRMLWEKGIREFVEAANRLYSKYNKNIEFRLYGKIDMGNPSAIPKNYLEGIEISNYLKWYGFKEDMKSVFNESTIIVLPSFYREGCPMVLMEACAMGLPIVTTDSVGCRECVDEGINGFKVSIKSVKELTEAIEKLIIDKDLRIRMGKASRQKAERDFDQNKVISQYIEVFEKMQNV